MLFLLNQRFLFLKRGKNEASVYIFQKRLNNPKNISIVSAICMIASTLILLISINKATIIIYELCESVFLVLLINKAETKRYEVINKDKEVMHNYLVEHQVLAEISLNISRILAYIILFIASLINSMVIFKILLAIVSLFIILYCSLMNKLDE